MEKPLCKWNSKVCAWIAAAVGGGALALGSLAVPPLSSDLASAARGMAGDGGGWDRVAAWLWTVGGANALSLVRWFGTWVVATLALLLVGWLITRVSAGLPRMARRFLLSTAGLLALALCTWTATLALLRWEAMRPPLSLAAPVDLVATIPEGVVLYANPSARASVWLFGKGAALAASTGSQEPHPQDISAWRASARESAYETVLLVGPDEEVAALLGHLIESPDWYLARMDHHGWVFRRGMGVDAARPDPTTLEAGSPRETALCLSRLSARFETMRDTPSARAAIERALELAPTEPEVLLYAARFAASRGRWHEVLSRAGAALRHGAAPSYSGYLIAMAHLESGNPPAAREAISRALRASPNDTSALFLLARISRAERDHYAEADALSRLVHAAKNAGLPHAGYEAYLAQAHAQTGNATAASHHYRQALASGQLNAEQSEAIREALATIESRAP